MDHDMQTYLNRFGQQNIFSILSEDECRAMLARLENVVEQEERIAQEVDQLKGASLTAQYANEYTHPTPIQNPTHTLLSEPMPTPENSIFTKKPWVQTQRGMLLLVTCMVALTTGWSVTLYSWAFEKGRKRGATLTPHTKKNVGKDLINPPRSSFLLRQPKLVRQKTSFQPVARTFSLRESLKPKHFAPPLQKRFLLNKLGVLRLTAPQLLKRVQRPPYQTPRQTRLLEKAHDHLSVENGTLQQVGLSLREPQSYRLKQNALSFSLSLWRNDPERYSM